MQVLLISNDGGGYADQVEIAEGTTVAKLFAKRMPGREAADFLLRVNRLPCTADQVLREGDRVTISPTKVHGA